MTEIPAVIRAEGVNKVFTVKNADPVIALKDIHLDVKRGEFVSLIGPSGCGKSTLLRLIDMGLAMAAADLCVCRSGASTLGELPYFGLPALLVPYPHAWRYQKVNADYLAQRGAAQILPDESLGELASKVRALLDAPGKLANMRAAALALRCDDAAGAIAELLLKVGAPR